MEREHYLGVNLHQLLLGNPMRLRFVERFSTFPHIFRETVAEHSFYTALYTMVMGEAVNTQPHQRIDVGLAVMKALVHDMEEGRSGDFPRPFKYSSNHLRLALNSASLQAMKQVVEKIYDNDIDRDLLCNLWQDSKDGSKEGRLVQFADFLSVLGYMWFEVKSGNSVFRSEQIEPLPEYFAIFKEQEFKFLEGWVAKCGKIVKEVLHG